MLRSNTLAPPSSGGEPKRDLLIAWSQLDRLEAMNGTARESKSFDKNRSDLENAAEYLRQGSRAAYHHLRLAAARMGAIMRLK
jgi:hypothetical protein